jgi:nucleotide-binding universal stress UspA family protein
MPATQTKQRVTFRNILFATDFSAAANAAMPYAAAFAKAFGSKLFALHVQDPVNYAVPPQVWQSEQLTHDMEIQCLRDTVQHSYPEVAPEVLQGQGGVWPALAAAIGTHDIDLLVVGTRGRTGVGKALLGSQAEEVLRHAICPVLTVGPQTPSHDRKPGKITSILFATNFGPASLAAAPIAVSLAEEFQCRLTLLHVVEDARANDATSAEEFMASSEGRLRDLVQKDANVWCAPVFTVEPGVAADKILEVAQRTNADLIVLGVHRPEGVPGAATHLPIATVHKVVANSACPVLTVRQCLNCQRKHSCSSAATR